MRAILLGMLLLLPLAAQAVEAGKPAPALVLTQFDGKTFDLSALRGKVAVVHFWATWCAACRLEMPALESIYERYRAHGLIMIAVSVDRAHDRGEAVRMMQAFHYPAALLSEAVTNGFGTADALPTTYVIDRAGVVRAALQPDTQALSEKDFSAAVAPLLAQHP